MNTFLRWDIGRLGFELGWFSGNNLSLLNVTLLELDDKYGLGLLTIIHIQVAKFAFRIFWDIS